MVRYRSASSVIPSLDSVMMLSPSSRSLTFGDGVSGGKTRMKSDAKRLISGQRIPRKVKNLTGSSSVVSSNVVWKYRNDENDARQREDSPTRESGSDSESVGWAGKESEAVA